MRIDRVRLLFATLTAQNLALTPRKLPVRSTGEVTILWKTLLKIEDPLENAVASPLENAIENPR